MKTALYLIFFAGSAVLFYFGYQAYKAYTTSDYDVQGFFVCNPDNSVCERSQHVHSDIEFIACGKEVDFPKEKGNTNHQHTHKELNKIHWHARERVDPKTQELLDKTPRMLKAFFSEIEYKIPDSCNGKPASVTLFVNGVENSEKLDYVWKDDDKLKVVVQ